MWLLTFLMSCSAHPSTPFLSFYWYGYLFKGEAEPWKQELAHPLNTFLHTFQNDLCYSRSLRSSHYDPHLKKQYSPFHSVVGDGFPLTFYILHWHCIVPSVYPSFHSDFPWLPAWFFSDLNQTQKSSSIHILTRSQDCSSLQKSTRQSLIIYGLDFIIDLLLYPVHFPSKN